MQDHSKEKIIETREVDKNRWADFERLFESHGAPKYCWCMAWRATPEEAKKPDSASRKIAMAKRIRQGIPVGLLGYINDEPVAWCSIAPRSTYRRLTDDEETDENIWSIVCFFIVRRLRGQGISRQMLQAAIEYARLKGASIVEAYPVDPDSPSYRFMGFVSLFENAGFKLVSRAGKRRYVMRLML